MGDETVGETAAYVLDLKPRPSRAGSSRASASGWTRAGSIPVQTRLTEPTGDHTTIRFENVVINGPLQADSFDLALPKDVVEVQ